MVKTNSLFWTFMHECSKKSVSIETNIYYTHTCISNRRTNYIFLQIIYSKNNKGNFDLKSIKKSSFFLSKMPIIVKDYTWTQSESRICINLPLKGTKATNLDILNSLDFIKVFVFWLVRFWKINFIKFVVQ